MDENLVNLALKKDDLDRSGAPRGPRGSVADWLGEDVFERTLDYLDEKKRCAKLSSLPGGLALALVLLFLLAGCASTQTPSLEPVSGYKVSDFSDTFVPGRTQPGIGLGSIFPGDQFRNPIADHRAAFINDLVTVNIVEDSEATGSAQTKTGRSSNIGAGLSGLFGFEQTLAKSRPNMNLDSLVSARTANSFDGSGETTRKTEVVATMTCTVVDAFPNGNLLIRGKRMIKVNGEDQIITLSGIVRPQDIDGANELVSSRLADARITYYGAGVIADKQDPGWMMRVFDNAWPF
jgi:flagellar L-ring protein FlgH